MLLETRFFYLIYFEKIDNFISIKNKLLITYFCLLLLLIGIIVTNKIKINNLNRWLTVYILFILFESFKNIFYYKLNLSQVITSIHGFLILLLAPFLIDIFKSKKDLKFIIKSITITSIIISALFIVQAIIYNINGQIILKVLKENDLIYEIRSYGIRLSQPSTIIVLSILISWGCLQQNYKNKLHLINIIISLT